MILFIYLCILVLNLVAIGLTYRFLGVAFEKKEKFIFISVGIAVMYMLVVAIYWLSTKNMQFVENVEMGMGTAKSLITFTFVPINMIILLPILASSYRAYKEGRLKVQNFKNRLIALAIILVIILIIEFFYFKDIQSGIIELINKANILS